MKKITFTLLLFAATTAHSQIVSDNLNWASTTAVSSQVSPNYDFCPGTRVNYEVSTNSAFTHVSSSGNPALTDGIIFPANPGGTATQNITIGFKFSMEVCNLRIHFVDIDGLSGEDISGISPVYSSLTSDVGTLTNPGSSFDAVDATSDNAAGWVNWSGSLTNVSFTYNRPGSGYGLIIDSIIFECCETPCECPHRTQINSVGPIGTDGTTYSNVNVNSMGIPVRSICIDLPFYVSNVSDDCLKCDPANKERFGTILGAAPIAGTPGILHDPYNLGYSRKICWTFPTPTVVNANIQIDLKFPEVLNLSCCKNSVSYCFDVNFKNEDCTSCEYTICTKFPQTVPAEKSESGAAKTTKVLYNDFAEKSGFQLNPNPAEGKVEVKIEDESLVGGQLLITTTSGATVLNTKVNQLREALNVSNLAKGTYVVSIENNGKVSSSLLMVK